jgi:hypothetical protein
MKEHARLTNAVLQRTIASFMRQYEAVRDTQSALLTAIVRRNRDTLFGIEHGFREIRDVRDYQRRVPVRHWVELSPYVDRVVQGQPDILTSEPPFLFHWTSGTTGKPKMIPVTRRCEAALKLTYRIWLYKAMLDNPRLLSGRVLPLLNAGVDAYTDNHVPYGSVSGNIYFRMPRILRQACSNTYDVYHIEDIEARLYTLLRFALPQNCSFMVSGNPTGLRFLFELADRYSETLIRDIHDGTLAARFEVPSHVRAAAASDLPPNPGRARALARAKEQVGRLRPMEYWPDLAAIGCWIGGSMGHFAPSLREWCGESFRFRDIGYMASEGMFSIPLGNETPDGNLTLHSAFFEFIPEAEFGNPQAPVLLADELEAGCNYQVVITTTGGLYRYAINDVIRVTGMVAGSPSIRFLYKGSNVQNLQGEMVSVDHVMEALEVATSAAGVNLRHFQVLADLADRRYVLHVEPMQEAAASALRVMLARFEQELGAQNVNYQFFRANAALRPPALRVMPTGWFARILADHVARGRRESQFKPFVLVSSAQYPEMATTEIVLEEERARA